MRFALKLISLFAILILCGSFALCAWAELIPGRVSPTTIPATDVNINQPVQSSHDENPPAAKGVDKWLETIDQNYEKVMADIKMKIAASNNPLEKLGLVLLGLLVTAVHGSVKLVVGLVSIIVEGLKQIFGGGNPGA